MLYLNHLLIKYNQFLNHILKYFKYSNVQWKQWTNENTMKKILNIYIAVRFVSYTNIYKKSKIYTTGYI